jgi:exonuclease I
MFSMTLNKIHLIYSNMSDQSMEQQLQQYKEANAILNAKVSILQNRILDTRSLLLDFRARMFYSYLTERVCKRYSSLPIIRMNPESLEAYSKFYIIKPVDS